MFNDHSPFSSQKNSHTSLDDYFLNNNLPNQDQHPDQNLETGVSDFLNFDDLPMNFVDNFPQRPPSFESFENMFNRGQNLLASPQQVPSFEEISNEISSLPMTFRYTPEGSQMPLPPMAHLGQPLPYAMFNPQMSQAQGQNVVYIPILIKKNKVEAPQPQETQNIQEPQDPMIASMQKKLERQMKIARYKMKKRQYGQKRLLYSKRKSYAEERVRVGGKFISQKTVNSIISNFGTQIIDKNNTIKTKEIPAVLLSNVIRSKPSKKAMEESMEKTRKVIHKLHHKRNLFKITH